MDKEYNLMIERLRDLKEELKLIRKDMDEYEKEVFHKWKEQLITKNEKTNTNIISNSNWFK